MNLKAGGEYVAEGLPQSTSELTLPAGWSLIGPPLGGVSVSAIEQHPPDNIISVFGFHPSTGFINVTDGILEAGQGYWVHLKTDGILRLTGGLRAAKKTP